MEINILSAPAHFSPDQTGLSGTRMSFCHPIVLSYIGGGGGVLYNTYYRMTS